MRREISNGGDNRNTRVRKSSIKSCDPVIGESIRDSPGIDTNRESRMMAFGLENGGLLHSSCQQFRITAPLARFGRW